MATMAAPDKLINKKIAYVPNITKKKNQVIIMIKIKKLNNKPRGN